MQSVSVAPRAFCFCCKRRYSYPPGYLLWLNHWWSCLADAEVRDRLEETDWHVRLCLRKAEAQSASVTSRNPISGNRSKSMPQQYWQSGFHSGGDTTDAALPVDEWINPRKGSLFTIVDALTEKGSES